MSNEATETAYDAVYDDPALTPTDGAIVDGEENPFSVGDEVEVDFTKVQRELVPAASGVLFEVLQSSTATTRSGAIKYLKVKLKIVDGIVRQDEATGEQVMKYANKIVFPGVMDLAIWHDPNAADPKGWWKEQDNSGKPYLFNAKCFAIALGFTDLSKVKFNDAFHAAIVGKQIIGNIRHKTNRDESIDVSYDGWKKAPETVQEG